jgi:proline dehydrogenase
MVLEKLIIAALPAIPRPIMRRLSARYIAGETLGEAIERLKLLRAAGFAGVLDILGEDVADEAAARGALAEYRGAATEIAEHGLDAYVSVKPSHFGVRISEDLAFELYNDLLAHASSLGQAVRVEMEDHTTTDTTLRLFARLREVHDNVTLVLQARLFRTVADIAALPTGPIDIRMVKGIYLEHESIAHTGAGEIRDAFFECSRQLIASGNTLAIASHDEHLAARLLRSLGDDGVPPERYYFEVLLGVQEQLWHRWKDAGHVVRVYVPYGPHWRSYSQRRLRKNPEILRHVIRGAFQRATSRAPVDGQGSR